MSHSNQQPLAISLSLSLSECFSAALEVQLQLQLQPRGSSSIPNSNVENLNWLWFRVQVRKSTSNRTQSSIRATVKTETASESEQTTQLTTCCRSSFYSLRIFSFSAQIFGGQTAKRAPLHLLVPPCWCSNSPFSAFRPSHRWSRAHPVLESRFRHIILVFKCV